MLTRRILLKRSARAGAAALAWPAARALAQSDPDGVVLNDVHSQLNPTRVHRVVQPTSVGDVQAAVRQAADTNRTVSIAGGRHAMGGQQFGTDALHLDMTRMNRVLDFGRARGLVRVQGGIQWPELISYLLDEQRDAPRPWGIVQKQTGADRLSIGGALAANVHGRGLTYKPFVQDIEAFTLVTADGERRACSRDENADLFALAVGGYGLFGVIADVTLRLTPRRKVERVVEVIDIDDLMPAFAQRIEDGYLFGDCQYVTDPASEHFLTRGVFSCYRPVDDATEVLPAQRRLSEDDWQRLYFLSHTEKARAWEVYSQYYLSTSGQVYWSDTHQLSTYLDDYHAHLDRAVNAPHKGSEMITELYVPRAELGAFMREVREDCRAHGVDVIYGTIRLIERDDETFLPWAREPWACVIFNLHVDHTRAGTHKAAQDFRRLIARALARGGSYFLTYHRWATREQLLTAYPRMPEFLAHKRAFDPHGRFQSDWFRHYAGMFA